jgi:hypothetical protein
MKEQRMPDMATRRIVVGLDFGTTYSGLAWADTSNPDACHGVSGWPGGDARGAESEKVPTTLNYDGYKARWGFEVAKGGQGVVYEWFKL